MSRRSVAWLIGWMFVLIAGAWAQESDVPSSNEPRPQDGIYDPGEWIFGPTRGRLARELATIEQSSGLDVLVAVIERPGKADPQSLADELAARWGNLGGRALILQIPESTEGPWIAISGRIRSEIPPEVLEPIVDRARQRGRIDPTVHGAVLKTVGSLSDDLRYLSGQKGGRFGAAPPTREVAAPGLKELIFFLINHIKQIVVGFLVIVGGLYLIGRFAVKIWKKARFSLTPKIFPDISWNQRFGAPHAGIAYTHSGRKNIRNHDS